MMMNPSQAGEGVPLLESAAGPPVPVEELAGRITVLEQAFRAFEGQVPGLGVEVVGTMSERDDLVHPVAGFEVRLEREDGRAVSLYISASYAELSRWVDAPTGRGLLRERFNVRLSEGFTWGDTTFPDARGLAHDLIGYLQYNLDLPD
jgi:hypothetical protein